MVNIRTLTLSILLLSPQISSALSVAPHRSWDFDEKVSIEFPWWKISASKSDLTNIKKTIDSAASICSSPSIEIWVPIVGSGEKLSRKVVLIDEIHDFITKNYEIARVDLVISNATALARNNVDADINKATVSVRCARKVVIPIF